MPNLTLFYMETCPYCTRVRNFMDQSRITIPLKDIRKDPAARNELIKIGGKPQVPCLLIDGTALYESLDIIDWLKNNWESHTSPQK